MATVTYIIGDTENCEREIIKTNYNCLNMTSDTDIWIPNVFDLCIYDFVTLRFIIYISGPVYSKLL